MTKKETTYHHRISVEISFAIAMAVAMGVWALTGFGCQNSWPMFIDGAMDGAVACLAFVVAYGFVSQDSNAGRAVIYPMMLAIYCEFIGISGMVMWG